MNIRVMQMEDYDAVYALWLSCTGVGLNNLDDSAEGIARFLRRNPETCFVAEESGSIVGCILAGNDGRRGYIYHMAVHPEQRKCGIGTAMVEKAVQALEDIGIHKAALVVFERNIAGNVFWEKMGFTVREDLVYRNRTITDMVRMDT